MALFGSPSGGGWAARYAVAAMIAACGIFGMMLPPASISMKDALRVRVTSRRSLGSMFSVREWCLLPWLLFELEPMPMAESAVRRALDSEAACLLLSSTSCILTCFLCSSIRSMWYAISRSREAPTGRILLPAAEVDDPIGVVPVGWGDWLLLFPS